MLTTFLKETDQECNLETCSREQVDQLLSRCYVAMKSKDGGCYQELGYLGFRAAIQRQSNVHDGNFNIFPETEFTNSNEVLDGVLKQRRREEDMNPVKHKEPITSFDLEYIKQFFDKNKRAQNLSRHVWFCLSLHLGLRG